MTQTKATVILAQVFMSCLMAFLMTGIIAAMPMQFQAGSVGPRLQRFVVAWPVAFVLSLTVGPFAFRLARPGLRFTRRPGDSA